MFMASQKPFISNYSVRSVSFPARSHPTIHKLERELNNLSSSAASLLNADSICRSLSALSDLYISTANLLDLPLIRQALPRESSSHQEKWVRELLDTSVRFLDVCGKTRDSVLSMKRSVRELQSALRRSKAGGELSNIEPNIQAFTRSRKNMKKEMGKCCLITASWMSKKIDGSASNEDSNNSPIELVSKVVREASLATASLFRSLLLFLSAPAAKKRRPVTKWSAVLGLAQKGRATGQCDGAEENGGNELQRVDVAVSSLSRTSCTETDKFHSAYMKLEGLELVFEDLEGGLELFFRCLIHCRVSLLNVISQ